MCELAEGDLRPPRQTQVDRGALVVLTQTPAGQPDGRQNEPELAGRAGDKRAPPPAGLLASRHVDPTTGWRVAGAAPARRTLAD